MALVGVYLSMLAAGGSAAVSLLQGPGSRWARRAHIATIAVSVFVLVAVTVTLALPSQMRPTAVLVVQVGMGLGVAAVVVFGLPAVFLAIRAGEVRAKQRQDSRSRE